MSGEAAPAGLIHRALFYRDESEYAAGIVPFVTAGLVAGEAVMIAVPRSTVDRLRDALGARTKRVHFVDMSELGRNPGRLIPAVFEFVSQFPGRRARVVGEPVWPGRSAEALAEATRHEALVNLAFGDLPVEVVCPYDTGRLDPATVEESLRTHPEIEERGAVTRSDRFCDPTHFLADENWPLATAPEGASVIEFADPGSLRLQVRRIGAAAGLGVDRLEDLVLAVDEVASNAVRHGGGGGVLRVWADEGAAVVCEVSDAGLIRDPLVGRYAPGPGCEPSGLWLVNQLCDLVEIRSGPGGTLVRFRFELVTS